MSSLNFGYKFPKLNKIDWASLNLYLILLLFTFSFQF